MKPNNNRKKTLRRKRKLRRIKLIRNAACAGLLLGIAASLCKALLSGGMPLKAASPEPVLTVHNYASEYGTGANPPLQTSEPEEEISASSDQETPTHTDKTVFEYAGQVVSDTLDRFVDVDISKVSDTADRSGSAKPVDQRSLTDADVDARLAELALQNDDIAEIYANKELYPEDLLKALSTNPEMTDFVKGYLTADKAASGGISENEKSQEFPLFIQWDKRWGYVPYGKKSNIGISGCGPTCMSMVIFALTRNEAATPDALAAFGVENGYYMEGEGTAWLFMKDAAREYGLTATELGLDETVIRQYLDKGRPVICAMRPGDFTTTGHFIVIYGYDKEGLLINDPNSLERSSKHWSFDAIKWQIRNLWGYSL